MLILRASENELNNVKQVRAVPRPSRLCRATNTCRSRGAAASSTSAPAAAVAAAAAEAAVLAAPPADARAAAAGPSAAPATAAMTCQHASGPREAGCWVITKRAGVYACACACAVAWRPDLARGASRVVAVQHQHGGVAPEGRRIRGTQHAKRVIHAQRRQRVIHAQRRPSPCFRVPHHKQTKRSRPHPAESKIKREQ
jgi:hypothetical protein